MTACRSCMRSMRRSCRFRATSRQKACSRQSVPLADAITPFADAITPFADKPMPLIADTQPFAERRSDATDDMTPGSQAIVLPSRSHRPASVSPTHCGRQESG